MNKSIFFACLLFFLMLSNNYLFAQKWIPKDVHNYTILVERFNYQDPLAYYDFVDEMYELEQEEFLEEANERLENDNDKLDAIFQAYKHKYLTVSPSKINEYDKNEYRYVLRRELFYGNKKVINTNTSTTEDQSYFAYRYYFYDRQTGENYPAYYYSGDQYNQLKRIVFWLNRAKNN